MNPGLEHSTPTHITGSGEQAAPVQPEADQDLLDKLAATLAENHVETDRFDAQVWLMASESRLARYMDDQAERLALLQLVYREAHRTNLDPDLVLAVMQVESHFDRYAISRVGAQGLMQLMPPTAADLGVQDAYDPEQNVDAGTRYLAGLLKTFKREDLALAAYNAGPGRVRRAGGIPRIRETQRYVKRVMALARAYGG